MVHILLNSEVCEADERSMIRVRQQWNDIRINCELSDTAGWVGSQKCYHASSAGTSRLMRYGITKNFLTHLLRKCSGR